MITFIIKSVLCSGSLFLIYYLLLEREKMYRFNRFYLLFSLFFSFAVFFITFTVHVPAPPVPETPVMTGEAMQVAPSPQDYAPAGPVNLLPYLLTGLYVVVTFFLLLRFVRNLYRMLEKARCNPKITFGCARLVLTPEKDIPHSFLNFIFIDKEKYERGQIEKEILHHELTHVSQRHTLDILLIELLMVFVWFNPVLFLFRRAMLLNHEFLADDSVVRKFNDAGSYQLLLFEKVNSKNNILLSSPFNYLTTKKRLIMMTRETSQKVAILKQIAIVPLVAAIGLLFSNRVVAQDIPVPQKQNQVEPVKPDSTQNKTAVYKEKLDKEHQAKSIMSKKIKRDKEQQAKLMEEQKIALDKAQQSQSLIEQKVALDKAQQSKILDEQKTALDNQQKARTMYEKAHAAYQKGNGEYLQQKIEMDKELQAQSGLDKSKLSKEQLDRLHEQQIRFEAQMKKQEKNMKEHMVQFEKRMKEQEAQMQEQKVRFEKKMKEKEALLMKQQARMEEQMKTQKVQEAK